jgi:sugar/nucleoside kinase (ribokinase family)
MCVDILLPPHDPIPPLATLKTEAYLAELTKDAPPESSWEVGGNCNFLIAAARIGLRAECAGHVGDDAYGTFLERVLSEEGVPLRRLASPEAVAKAAKTMMQTLLCFVITDGAGGHAFCSRYDLGPWPLLADVHDVDAAAANALAKCKAVFVNGFVFDELKPSAVIAALGLAKSNGASVFFDPGPRAFTFTREDDPERREALEAILGATDVVLATVEEAAALVKKNTGGGKVGGEDVEAAAGTLDPVMIARELFNRPGCTAQWVVIKAGADGACIHTRRGDQVYVGSPKVDVRDTVGCGDAAAAAIVLGFLKISAKRQKLFDASSGKIAYLPNGTLAEMMEETLTLAAAIGAATATGTGAGRNVASADKVRELLEECAVGDEGVSGVNPKAAMRAQRLMNDTLRFGL